MFYCGAARLATAAATCVLPVVLRCGAARLAAAACALPAVSPSGGCVSCRAVVLPTLPLLPARCLPCRRRAVGGRAALWCCPCRRCHCRLLAACRVAVRRLHVVPHCGAACIAAAAAACALPVVLPSGGCVSCRAVVLPASPPLPARCLPCHRRAVACRAALWCCPRRRRRRRRLRAACRVAVGRLRVVPCCGAARITTTAAAAAALLIVSLSGSCVSCSGVLLPMLPLRCSSCRRRVAATVAADATGLCLHTQSDE